MWERPAPAVVWRAIERYLSVAYGGASPPPPVTERLARLRSEPDASFYESDVLERGEDRYALRLGNASYPHMKLVVARAPDGQALFRADTHDRHVLELLGPSDPRFTELMERNAAVARAIEDAWSAEGLLTLRECVREQAAAWRATHG